MQNDALKALQPLIGKWDLTMHHTWFLDSPETKVAGWATFERLDNSFVVWRWEIGEPPVATCVIGHSDAQQKYEMFSYDTRGMSRIFDMNFDGKTWTLLREDDDFYQRFRASVTADRIEASFEASENKGKSWRKDFDLTFVKRKDE